MFNEDFFKESENVTILAHRGFWQKEEEKNSITAFKRAFQNGFGIETDRHHIKQAMLKLLLKPTKKAI